MNKLLLLAAFGAGYVVGAAAGRERYETLRSGFERVRTDPRVQEKTQQAVDLAKEQAPVIRDKVAATASSAVTAASEKVRSATSSEPDPDLVEQLHPDSTARQEDPYPKGDLP